MTTPILAIPELSDGQINQYLTCNEALRMLESSTNDFLNIDLSGAGKVLTQTEFARSILFVCSGNTVARSVTVPASKRFFIISNTGTFLLSVIRGATTFFIHPGDKVFYYCDGTVNGLFFLARAGASFSPVVTVTGASLNASASDAGSYARFTGGAASYNFSVSAALPVGSEYHGRNASVGALLTLAGTGGFVLNAPAGGTLVVPYGGTFTVKIVAAGVADVIGVTEAAA